MLLVLMWLLSFSQLLSELLFICTLQMGTLRHREEKEASQDPSAPIW